MTDSVRLAKHIADLASCSRREAEQYIEGGWVEVDGGVVEEPGYRLQPGQVVTLMPQASLAEVEPVTILLNKPAGIDAPVDDMAGSSLRALLVPEQQADGDRSSQRFLRRHLNKLTLAVPLEQAASGLVVLSQDWRISRKLIEDAARVEQEYIVEVKGALDEQGLALLNHGLSWNGKPLAPMKVSWQNENRLRFALKDCQRGLIAHLCQKVGLTVVSMKRIRIGRVPMSSLPVGQWRYLLGYERF